MTPSHPFSGSFRPRRGARRRTTLASLVSLTALTTLSLFGHGTGFGATQATTTPPPAETGTPGLGSGHRPPGPGEESSRPPRGGRFFNRPMTPDDHAAAVEVLKILDPHQAEQVAAALEEDPAQVDQLIRERFPQLGRMLSMRRFDPHMFDLRLEDLRVGRQVIAAAEALRTARESAPQGADLSPQITERTAALRTAVAAHYETRRRIRAHELERLEQRIAELKNAIADETARRDLLIEERLAALISGAPEAGDDRKFGDLDRPGPGPNSPPPPPSPGP